MLYIICRNCFNILDILSYNHEDFVLCDVTLYVNKHRVIVSVHGSQIPVCLAGSLLYMCEQKCLAFEGPEAAKVKVFLQERDCIFYNLTLWLLTPYSG